MSSEPAAPGRESGALGPLLIVSGPSGSGKSTVIQRFLAATKLPVRLSVSATTRLPRLSEQDGIDYHFWSPEQFEKEVQDGAFVEWAEVHGRRYGTLRREVEPFRQRGVGVILDIDVQGAAQVRRHYPDNISVFLLAPSLEAYAERLRRRGTESEEAIQRRLVTADEELARASEYDYQVINDDLDSAVSALTAFLERQFVRDPHVR